MTILVGTNTTIKIAGTSTSMTAEACSEDGSEMYTNYQITSATKRAIDPAYAVHVYSDGVEKSDADYTLDYANGKIVLDSMDIGPITITGYYIPLLSVARASVASFSRKPVTGDVSAYGDASPKLQALYYEVTGTIEHTYPYNEDLDSGAGTTTIATLLAAEKVFMEISVGGSHELRGWFHIEDTSVNAKHTDLVRGSLTFRSVVQQPVGSDRSSSETVWSLVTT